VALASANVAGKTTIADVYFRRQKRYNGPCGIPAWGTIMIGDRSHVTEWAEFVDAEVPESELSGERDRPLAREH